MLLKRGTGKNEKWEQNRKLEMKSLIGLSRVQVRFCSHFLFPRSPFPVLVSRFLFPVSVTPQHPSYNSLFFLSGKSLSLFRDIVLSPISIFMWEAVTNNEFEICRNVQLALVAPTKICILGTSLLPNVSELVKLNHVFWWWELSVFYNIWTFKW